LLQHVGLLGEGQLVKALPITEVVQQNPPEEMTPRGGIWRQRTTIHGTSM
jgi:hypothetical protein